MFYSKSTSGFYVEEIHGSRKIKIIDPAFIWPQIEVANPLFDPETALVAPTILIDDPDCDVPLIRIINPDCKMPSEVVEITEEVHAELMVAQGLGATIQPDDNGYPVAIFPAPPTIAELKRTKLAEINADFEESMALMIQGYPTNEIASWSKQEAEARAFKASNTAVTPLIDALALARGINKWDLSDRIIAKADFFAAASGQLIGQRQAIEDALDALPDDATAEEIEQVGW